MIYEISRGCILKEIDLAKKTSSGISFIEILISLFILSLLLLTVDSMGIVALKEAKINYFLAVAHAQLSVMVGRLETLRSRSEVERAMYAWNLQNQEVLPKGRGRLQGHYPCYQLAIFWGEGNENKCERNKVGSAGCLQQKIVF